MNALILLYQIGVFFMHINFFYAHNPPLMKYIALYKILERFSTNLRIVNYC